MAINPIAQRLIDYLRQKQANDTPDDGTDDGSPENPSPKQRRFMQALAAQQNTPPPSSVSSDVGNNIGSVNDIYTPEQGAAMAAARVNNPQVNGVANGITDPRAIALYNNIPHFNSSDPFTSPTGQDSDNSDNYDVNKLLQQKLREYSQLAASPAKKQNLWAQAAFVGLQALQHGLDPRNTAPIELLGNAKKARQLSDMREAIAPLIQQQQIQQQTQQAQDNSTYKKAQINALTQKPNIDRARIDAQRQRDQATAEYHNNLVTLGKQKADDIKAYRDDIIDLKQQGVDQNDTRIQQAQQRIDELIRNNKAKNAQAATNEQGKNDRFSKAQQLKANLTAAKMRFEQAMQQFKTAAGAGKVAAQTNYNNARAAYLDALTKSKNGQ